MDLATAQQASDLLVNVKALTNQITILQAAIANGTPIASGPLFIKGVVDFQIPALTPAESAILCAALVSILQPHLDSHNATMTSLKAI